MDVIFGNLLALVYLGRESQAFMQRFLYRNGSTLLARRISHSIPQMVYHFQNYLQIFVSVHKRWWKSCDSLCLCSKRKRKCECDYSTLFTTGHHMWKTPSICKLFEYCRTTNRSILVYEWPKFETQLTWQILVEYRAIVNQ